MAFNIKVFHQWHAYVSTWDTPGLSDIYDHAGYIYGGSNLDVGEVSIPSSWLGTAGDRRFPAADTLEISITGTAYDDTAYSKVIKYTWTGLTVDGGGNSDLDVEPSHVKDAGGSYVAATAAEKDAYRIRIINGPSYAMINIRPDLPPNGPQPGPFKPGTEVSINSMVFEADNYDVLANNNQAHFYANDYNKPYDPTDPDPDQTVTAFSVVKITEGGADATLAGQDVGDTLSVYGSAGWLSTEEGNAVSYQWNLDGVPVVGATSSTYVADTAGTVTVTVTDDETGAASTSDGVSVNAAAQGAFVLDEDFESTNVGSLPGGFTTSGTAGWEVVSNGGAYEGTKHLISQDIDDNQTATLEYSLTITEAAVLNFWWNVSSEADYDKLHFYVDGVEVGSGISGEPGWTKVSHTFSAAGTYELKWTYFKDVSASAGDDIGMLDKITVQNINEDTSGGNNMSKTRINVRQVDLELSGGLEDYETMSEAVAAEGAGGDAPALYGKLVPAKFDPKYLGVSLSVADYDGVASDYTIVNKGLLDNVKTALQTQIDGNDTDIAANAAAITAEETRALAAEAALSTAIADEEARALAAEGVLSGSIADEEARALAAEGVLEKAIMAADGRIDWILSGSTDSLDQFVEVVQAFQSADGTLSGSIAALTTTAAADRALIRSEFAAADTTLQSNIDDEEARALAAEGVLQAAINTVQSDVDQNEADSDAAEAALSARLDTLESDPVTKSYVDAEITSTLASEMTFRGGVDASSAVTFPTEANGDVWVVTASGSAAVHGLGGLDLEVGDMIVVQTKDSSGATLASSEYHLIQKNLTDYISATEVNGAIAALQADVDANEAAADAAITAEETRALAAEAALSGSIVDEETRALAAEAALQAAINTVQSDVDQNEADADAAIAANVAAITAEEARALAAEAALSGSIVDAEIALAKAIAAEEARAVAAEDLLTTDVSELNVDVLALHGRHFRASSVVNANGTYSVDLADLADEGSLQVFVNGMLMVSTVDYTVATAGGVMTVSVLGCEAGDDVTVMGQKQVSLTSQ